MRFFKAQSQQHWAARMCHSESAFPRFAGACGERCVGARAVWLLRVDLLHPTCFHLGLPLLLYITRTFVTLPLEMVSDNPCSSGQLQVSGLGIHTTHFAVWLQSPVHKVAGAEAKLPGCSVLLWIKLSAILLLLLLLWRPYFFYRLVIFVKWL